MGGLGSSAVADCVSLLAQLTSGLVRSTDGTERYGYADGVGAISLGLKALSHVCNEISCSVRMCCYKLHRRTGRSHVVS